MKLHAYSLPSVSLCTQWCHHSINTPWSFLETTYFPPGTWHIVRSDAGAGPGAGTGLLFWTLDRGDPCRQVGQIACPGRAGRGCLLGDTPHRERVAGMGGWEWDGAGTQWGDEALSSTLHTISAPWRQYDLCILYCQSFSSPGYMSSLLSPRTPTSSYMYTLGIPLRTHEQGPTDIHDTTLI